MNGTVTVFLVLYVATLATVVSGRNSVYVLTAGIIVTLMEVILMRFRRKKGSRKKC